MYQELGGALATNKTDFKPISNLPKKKTPTHSRHRKSSDSKERIIGGFAGESIGRILDGWIAT
jgi:hypothetical protein